MVSSGYGEQWGVGGEWGRGVGEVGRWEWVKLVVEEWRGGEWGGGSG